MTPSNPDPPEISSGPGSSFAARIDPRWSADWIRRTLTDEPGKGMGSPFSEADAQLFLRACGVAPSEGHDKPVDPPTMAPTMALLERMLAWLKSSGRK